MLLLTLATITLSDGLVPRMDRADGFELRVDRVGSVGPLVMTPEGYWICDAIIAVPGIMAYQEGNKTIREFVPPSTLSDPEWLASLENQPVTVEHPRTMVTSASMGKVRVGIVLPPVVWKDNAVRARLRIDDQRGIDAIQFQNKQEVSPGYAARVERVAGNDPVYGEYHRIQVERKHGNHVALTEQGRAPAGAARLFLGRVDSADGVIEEGLDVDGAPVLLLTPGPANASMMPPMPSATPVVELPPVAVIEPAPMPIVPPPVVEVAPPVMPAVAPAPAPAPMEVAAKIASEIVEEVVEAALEAPAVSIPTPAPLPEIEVEVKVCIEVEPKSTPTPDLIAPLPEVVTEVSKDSLPTEVSPMNPMLLAVLASLALPTTGYADDAAGWAAVDKAIASAKGGAAAPVVAPVDPAKQAELDTLKGKVAALEPELAAKKAELDAAKARIAEMEGGAMVEEMIDAAMEAGPAPAPDAMVTVTGEKMDSAKATAKAARLGKIYTKVLASAQEVSRLDSLAAPLKIEGFDKLGSKGKRAALVTKMDSKQAGQSDAFNQAFIALKADQIVAPPVKVETAPVAPVVNRTDSAPVDRRFRSSRTALNNLTAAHNTPVSEE